MNYLSSDKNEKGESTPRGQIWLRGPMIFMGYYKNMEKTKEALTEDGWLRTGDVGMLLPGSNALKIIDRSKNIFKLQQGQYVAAQKVQRIYSQCPLVGEVFLHGESTEIFAVAILTMKKQNLVDFAKNLGITDIQKELNSKPLREAVVK